MQRVNADFKAYVTLSRVMRISDAVHFSKKVTNLLNGVEMKVRVVISYSVRWMLLGVVFHLTASWKHSENMGRQLFFLEKSFHGKQFIVLENLLINILFSFLNIF